PRTHAPEPSALAELADAYAERDDRARALEYYTMSLQANPGNDRVRRKLLDMGVDVATLIPEFVVAPATLATYAGRYRFPGDIVGTIRQVQDAALEIQVFGLPDTLLVPISEDVFFLENTEAQLTFNRDASGKVESLTWLLYGREVHASKIE
ncbi:MAG: DUF3471 domain-containing protein, partial [Boseongicola sp. SB0670_bin_30]|nr:DUF3471 domain-containing protein [Boseongicola sp. SB0670_bin_30]